jgi:prepilin signal peptidase PulO-like enzyme (type II secretory pathway)
MDWVAIAVGFLFLLYASIHDFRTREVPDLVSYGFILFAVSYGVGKAMLLSSWQPMLGNASRLRNPVCHWPDHVLQWPVGWRR